MQEAGIEKAIQFCGSVTKLAEKLRIDREEIYRYRYGTTPIKLQIAAAIEKLTQGKITFKELLPWKLKNYLVILHAPCLAKEISLEAIFIPKKIPCFSDQKDISPLNQKPICVDENNGLIYGLEAIEACKKQGKKSVLSWKLSLSDLLNGKYEVEDLVKTFDQLERTAIGVALEIFLGNRQGFRADLIELVDSSSTSEIKKGTKTRNLIAKRAGFASDYIYRQLKKILKNGHPELIYQLRHNKITVSKAAAIANLSPDQQLLHLSQVI